MSNATRLQRLAGLLAGGTCLFGCAHAQVKAAGPAPEVAAAAPRPEATPPQRTAQTQEDISTLLAGDILHFGFDEANLTAESRSRLQQLAGILGQHPGLKIRIDGNCDERGTEEYNLALGSRRAAAAKAYLGNLGVNADRISIISYGKERPVATGHDEQAWAQNRRDGIEPGPANGAN